MLVHPLLPPSVHPKERGCSLSIVPARQPASHTRLFHPKHSLKGQDSYPTVSPPPALHAPSPVPRALAAGMRSDAASFDSSVISKAGV